MIFSEENSITLSKRLKELRKEKGLSHERLYDELNQKVGLQSLKDYEVTDLHHSKFNSAKGMKAETLYNLADFYSVSTDYLLGRTQLKSPNPDYINLHELTGLTDNAMITLEQAKNDEYTLKAINAILGCDSFARMINNFANLLKVHEQNAEDNNKYRFELNAVSDMEDMRRDVIEKMAGIKYK